MSDRVVSAAGLLAPVAGAVLVWATVHFAVADRDVFEYGMAVVALATLVVIAAASRSWGPVRVLEFWPLAAIGTVSYAVYLWHWPTILVLNPYRADWGNDFVVALEAAVALGLAVGSWFLVERPLARRSLPRGRVAT